MSSKLVEKIATALKNIVDLYREDELPWIIGYSGGKDSTTVLQLVWRAVESIPLEERTKKIFVISTDTLVENPVVAEWVKLSLTKSFILARAIIGFCPESKALALNFGKDLLTET